MIIKPEHRQKLPVSDSLLKYLVVGVAAFIVEYGTFYLLYEIVNWKLYIANSISFGLGLSTSFLLNRAWTFVRSSKRYSKKAAHQLSFYVVLALINLLLTNLIVILLKDLQVNPKFGKLAAMVITSLWNYLFFKAIIFTHKDGEKK
jgi:putative flippase GtrA